jgi:hypothetical protein
MQPAMSIRLDPALNVHGALVEFRRNRPDISAADFELSIGIADGTDRHDDRRRSAGERLGDAAVSTPRRNCS